MWEKKRDSTIPSKKVKYSLDRHFVAKETHIEIVLNINQPLHEKKELN